MEVQPHTVFGYEVKLVIVEMYFTGVNLTLFKIFLNCSEPVSIASF